MSADQQIEALNLDLPPAPKPAGVYQPVLIIGNLAYVSGHGPLLNDETYITGKAAFSPGDKSPSSQLAAGARSTMRLP